MSKVLVFACITLMFALSACTPVESGAQLPAPRPIALENVSIVDVTTGIIESGLTIVIRDGLIAYIGSSPSETILADATHYALGGRYVIPGLWDMHVHLRGGRSLEDENSVWMRQYLGYGVTSVRDAGGDIPRAVIRWRDEIAAGQRESPRIYTALQKVDGALIGSAGSIRIRSEEDIDDALDRLTEQGADFIKLYDSSLNGELYVAVIEAAERRGLKTAGHLPHSVAFRDAIEAGLDSVEHCFFMAKAASTKEEMFAAEVETTASGATRLLIRASEAPAGRPLGYFGRFTYLARFADENKLTATIELMRERGAAITPTLAALAPRSPDDLVNDERFAQVPRGIRATYEGRLSQLAGRTPEEIADSRELYEICLRYTAAAANGGVTILAGTDTGADNPGLYPGYSLHSELERLVEAGLSPLEALQAATVNAAKWIGQSARFGTIEEGKVADLVVLDANPLEEIQNTRSIVSVVFGGRYLDDDDLAELRALTLR